MGEPKTKRVATDVLAGHLVHLRGLYFLRKCRSTAMLTDKTVIITGGNRGIGKETALDLAARGANIIIACRDVKKGHSVVEEIKEKVPSAKVIVKSLDLASFKSIRDFSADILNTVSHIHILINNAGISAVPELRTVDGFEMEFGVNHLGHFLLTTLLLDKIKASAPARIVNVSSVLYLLGKIDYDDLNLDRRYTQFSAYCRSKLANILFTRELANRLEGTGVTTYALHPGLINTALNRNVGSSYYKFLACLYNGYSKLFYASPHKGAQTTIYCAVEESLAQQSGFYYCYCTRVTPVAKARDDNMAKRLWEISEGSIASVNEG